MSGIGSSAAQKVFETRNVQIVSVIKTHVKVPTPRVNGVPPSFDASFIDPETGERSPGDAAPHVISVQGPGEESDGVYLPQ